MNAVFNEIPGSDGVETSADERIVAALLDKGRLKDADLVARAPPAGGDRRQPADACSRGWAWCPSATTPKPRRPCSACRWSAPRTRRNCRRKARALSMKFMKQFHVVPVAEARQAHVDVLVADPQDVYALDAVRLATGREVRPQVALRSEIDDLIER